MSALFSSSDLGHLLGDSAAHSEGRNAQGQGWPVRRRRDLVLDSGFLILAGQCSSLSGTRPDKARQVCGGLQGSLLGGVPGRETQTHLFSLETPSERRPRTSLT